MKNKAKRFIHICAIIWIILTIIVTFANVIKYISGGYRKVDATIIEVNYFAGYSKAGNYYDRANGYVEWEYDGEIFESEERIDFPADAQEGDNIEIWIDAKNGEYALWKGLLYAFFACGINVLICVIILKFVKIKEE